MDGFRLSDDKVASDSQLYLTLISMLKSLIVVPCVDQQYVDLMASIDNYEAIPKTLTGESVNLRLLASLTSLVHSVTLIREELGLDSPIHRKLYHYLVALTEQVYSPVSDPELSENLSDNLSDNQKQHTEASE